MIYRNNTRHMSRQSLDYIFEENLNQIGSMANTTESPVMLEYTLRIPKEYAREESNKIPKDPSTVPHYELYIERQVGSYKNRRSTYIFWKLPKTGRLVAVELLMDGGVDFKKDEHKYILRETDELDRRIILGFCLKYQSLLKDECYSDDEPSVDLWLYARHYKVSEMPKRIKKGSTGRDMTPIYRKLGLEPYEESGLFNQVQFV